MLSKPSVVDNEQRMEDDNRNAPPAHSRLVPQWLLIALVAVLLSLGFGYDRPRAAAHWESTERIAASGSDGYVAVGPCACDGSASFSAEMGLNGTVSDCCCSFVDIERSNAATVRPLLRRVVETPFFAHFKIDLCSDCPLWDDAPLCVLRDCGVCECDDPPGWAAEVDGVPPTGPGCEHLEDRVVAIVDREVSDGWEATTTSTPPFLGGPPTIAPSDDAGSVDGDSVVVDLRLNPERYTGYGGSSAEKVWSEIHSANCFQPPERKRLPNDEQSGSPEKENEGEANCLIPTEQRVYNRVISGLHSSISLHIAHSYCTELDPNRIGECRQWGTNAQLACERVLDHKDRIENLYFAFALMLRAVVKAGPAVTAAVPHGDSLYQKSLSEWTDSLLPEINRLADVCPRTFDEAGLLDVPEADARRTELHRRFRQLQQIMQCVGCDRCKLWGTLQTLGIGTALRVLFHDDAAGLHLSRQEAVALVHTLERFSSALFFADELKRNGTA